MRPATRARAAAYGAAVIALYLVSALVSGRITVLARRPLLDGFTPPPPYRYVNPPPDAISKEKPESATLPVKLTPPDLGAGVFSTKDQQATLVTEPGVFPAGTQGPVTITIEPLDPAGYARAPKGSRVAGNVYRFQAKAKDGTALDALTKPAHLVLVYPATGAAVFTAKHTLLTSKDGRSWRTLESNDAPATQQVSGDVTALGYFAVAQAGEEKKGINPGIIIGAIAGGVAAVGGVLWYVQLRRKEAARRRARARALAAKSRKRR
jgi:hypothetical protein